MKIEKATARYEAWLAKQITIVPADLQLKHAEMSSALFPFMRATYYRWTQIWPEICATWRARRWCWAWATCTSRILGRGAIPKDA